jgi:hypothetical protein
VRYRFTSGRIKALAAKPKDPGRPITVHLER